MRSPLLSGLISAAAILLLAAPILRAQSPLEADAASFRYDTAHAQVEIYYGVLERALAFRGSGNHFEAYVAARAEVWQGGKAVVKQDIRDTIRFQGTQAQVDSLGANKLLAIAGFSVPYAPSTQAAFIWQRGSQTGKSDTILIPLTLPDHDASHFALSGIELASSAEKLAGKPGPFEKAGYNLTPNPSAVFGENYTKLYYYTEMYVPQNLVGTGESAEVVTRVLDPSGKELLTSTQKVALSGPTIPLITSLDIDGLPEDSYKLSVRLKHEDAVQAEVEKPFFFSSGMKLSEEEHTAAPAANNDDVIFAASDLSRLSEAEADERLAQTLYLAMEADRKTASKLSTAADKQHFLFSFWRKQDVSQHTKQPLDAYTQFMKRVADVNKQFSYQKTPGWKSSRGRVYLTYGPPPASGIQNTPFSSEYKPYIIWTYDPTPSIQLRPGFGERPFFVFLDRQGGGNYFLVHSNAAAETSEPNWMSHEALRLSH